MTVIAAFRDVCKTFDGTSWAIRDLNLEVGRGEVLSLLGPSGSGKSTALTLLAGFEQPTSGQVLLGGRDSAGVPPHRRGLGLVGQAESLFPHMTVAENVAFPLRARRVSRSDQADRVARVLEKVGLGGFSSRRPFWLSGGQQQRANLARALVFGPSILVLDEPFGGLDAHSREELQLELRRIHDELGATILFATHDQSEALAISDRIAILQGGQLQQVATPTEVYERPANAFVAGFIGESNCLGGAVLTADEESTQIRLDCGPTVMAAAGDGLSPGRRCTVAIRPERVSVSTEDLGAGCLEAVLSAASYRGDHLRLKASVGKAEIVVKRPAMLGLAGLEPGRRIWLAWQPHHALSFRA